jgi:hypothetical protein
LDSLDKFNAALGWFDLGNYTEAWSELENLPPKDRASVEVMELRCRILKKPEKWWPLELRPKAARIPSRRIPASLRIGLGR